MNRQKIKATSFKRAKKLSFLCLERTDSKRSLHNARILSLAKNELFGCHIHISRKQQNITTVIYRIGCSAIQQLKSMA